MQKSNIIIAIDGYSSTGKSTFAKLIAAKLGYIYIDTGALYRAVTLSAIDHRIISENNTIDNSALEKLLEKTVIGSIVERKIALPCVSEPSLRKRLLSGR